MTLLAAGALPASVWAGPPASVTATSTTSTIVTPELSAPTAIPPAPTTAPPGGVVSSEGPEYPMPLPSYETEEHFRHAVWGIIGIDLYPSGDHRASNGVEFDQLFSFDLNFNMWIWRQRGIYMFVDSQFWGQKPGQGITSPGQGNFDFSKREFDLFPGLAWNYHGFWEARFFAYSYNSLNRGNSNVTPSGYADGVGVENRYYLSQMYANLGTPAFDQAKATFLSIGYYPANGSIIDETGLGFHPGLFGRAYLTYDVCDWAYVFADLQLLADQYWEAKLLSVNAGLAVRPFSGISRLEFRLGTWDFFDLQDSSKALSLYGSIRYIF
jgi:hypothetical protein